MPAESRRDARAAVPGSCELPTRMLGTKLTFLRVRNGCGIPRKWLYNSKYLIDAESVTIAQGCVSMSNGTGK